MISLEIIQGWTEEICSEMNKFHGENTTVSIHSLDTLGSGIVIQEQCLLLM